MNELLPLKTIRARFEALATTLICCHSGHSSKEEDAE